MQTPPDTLNVGDLVELALDRRNGENYTIIGIVLRIDTWDAAVLDLYVLWQDGEFYWIISDCVKKINLKY